MTRVPLRSVALQLQSIAMARYSLTGSRVSLSASTRVRRMHGKGESHVLKLTKQVMTVLDRIMVCLRQLVSIDDFQFGFVPGRGTTDAIFVEKQLQEKYLSNKRLYMAFVDLEKAFDGVPQKVIRWALRKLGVEEWIVRLVQGMNANERSHVRLCEGYSEELKWRSVFIKTRYSACWASSLCLKPCHASSALGSPERTSLQMTLVSLLNRLRNVTGGSWLGKRQWRRKNWVNAGKAMIMICGTGLDPLQSSGEFPYAVCRTGVGNNIIFWNSCKHWVHKIAESSSAWQRTLITDVHSARELHAAWTADHRGKSKTNLTSWG